MTREELLQRISIDPNVCFGKPCTKGHRTWVSLILDMLAAGEQRDDLVREYGITREDILACNAYGAEVSRERYVDVPLRRTA